MSSRDLYPPISVLCYSLPLVVYRRFSSSEITNRNILVPSHVLRSPPIHICLPCALCPLRTSYATSSLFALTCMPIRFISLSVFAFVYSQSFMYSTSCSQCTPCPPCTNVLYGLEKPLVPLGSPELCLTHVLQVPHYFL
jgi:hypothetical protein